MHAGTHVGSRAQTHRRTKPHTHTQPPTSMTASAPGAPSASVSMACSISPAPASPARDKRKKGLADADGAGGSVDRGWGLSGFGIAAASEWTVGEQRLVARRYESHTAVGRYEQ